MPLVQRILETSGDGSNYRAFLENGRYAPLVHEMKEDLSFLLDQTAAR